MPPKRTASKLTKVYAPSGTKLEDAAASPTDSGSNNDISDPTLRRSPRKRRRAGPEESQVKLDEDDGSSLTAMYYDECEEKPAAKSAPVNLDTSARSLSPDRSRTTAKVKMPLRQLKLEEMGRFFVGKDSKLVSDKLKPSTHALASPSKKTVNPPARKHKAIAMQLKKPHPAPPHWEEQYALIEEMRAGIQAPVDTMGCAAYMSGEGPLKDQRFGALVSLMLSSQTRDEITSASVANLRRILPGGLTIDSLLAADPSAIAGAIRKASFSQRKAEYLRATATILRDKFNGDVPKTVDELCSLPGVGPKMAFLVLQVAWNISVGIGVDVHVHRITN